MTDTRNDIDIRISGKAGRITLRRPKALNALSYDMCLAIEAALDTWAKDDAVALVLLDAEGERAFCAGGDIAELYETGTAGDFAYGRRFWADEYRLNHKIATYSKPVVSLLQGFTMGGGVGLGCHGSHRIVGDSSQIAMPECGIGLVPDVGGSLILARAPGQLGAYLGTTAARMGPADAILAGFADSYLPEADWPAVVTALEETGDTDSITAQTPPPGTLAAQQAQIDALFADGTLAEIAARAAKNDSDFAAATAKALGRVSPLSAACTLEMIRRLRADQADMAAALELEYRFTYRAMEQGDLLEGIRAAIIDKDRNPNWQHSLDSVPDQAVADMLAPLGAQTLTL